MRIACKVLRHNFKPVKSAFKGFRIKSICIRCGKCRDLRNKEFYLE